MSLFTLDQGTFAGHTIRITPDHYASIFDVIKVAGEFKNPHDTWNTVKERFSGSTRTSDSASSDFSDSVSGPCEVSNESETLPRPSPMVKTYKFKGQGQRETPVINGQGLIKLLFHLPGKKARAFVAEAAEKLVRFLGGDETLIAEIHRNRHVAATDLNSIQSFMAENVVEQNLAGPAATDVAAAAAQDERFGDVQNPWIAPNNWPQQQELFRYQVDPEAEAELQRSLVQQREVAAQKREAHVRQMELLRLKHELSLASFDHKRKYANAPTTRSANTNIRGGSGESKMLIHPDWDIKNPVTLHQAVAIFIDHFFEFGQVENVVMHYAIYTLFGAVMRYNYLGFESIADECVPAFHNQTMYKYATMIPPIAFACISIAKTQFPKTVTKNKARAWGWNTDATDGYYGGTVPMNCLMYLQPKMEHVLALGAYLREQKQRQA